MDADLSFFLWWTGAMLVSLFAGLWIIETVIEWINGER